MSKAKMGQLLFLAAFLLFPLTGQAAGTTVSSSITNPVWTTENSPYVVSGTIEVTKGAVLKIEAGTEIRFAPGAKIVVNGELQILGTTENPVTMTLETTASSTGIWGGIEFTPDSADATVKDGQYISGSIIKNAIIKFGQGIVCDDASPFIGDNQIMSNTTGLNIVGDNGSTGGAATDASTANTNIGLVNPIYIINNIFTDNTTAIQINRNNGQNYVVTPAGYSYVGEAIVTAIVKNNSLNSNGVGLNIINGDNNIITNNALKYNSVAGILAAAASRANVIEKNTINNNEIGLDTASPDTIIIQNNIKNNFSYGINITAKPGFFSLNNIYNNQNYNLKNTIYNLAAGDNYWGTGNETTAQASFLKTATASTTDTMIYPVIANPIATADNDLNAVMSPVLNNYSSTTIAASIELSGVKPIGSVVYINGQTVFSNRDISHWSYRANLNLGDNSFSVYYQDISGQQSNRLSAYVRRNNELAAPTITSSLGATSASILILNGTKPAGASILINGQEAVAADNLETWSYSAALAIGANNFELTAKDSGGQYSAAINISVIRNKDTAADIIAQEKKLTGTIDAKLAARLAGRLLLQVENKGYIWYVNPLDNKRYFISQDSALSIFRSLALGITESNLDLIPTKEGGQKGNQPLRARLKGRFMLRVENRGRISYIDQDGYRYDVETSNLMDIFRSLSLGITNSDLRKIAIGEVPTE